MGETMDAYLDSKDSEPNYNFNYSDFSYSNAIKKQNYYKNLLSYCKDNNINFINRILDLKFTNYKESLTLIRFFSKEHGSELIYFPDDFIYTFKDQKKYYNIKDIDKDYYELERIVFGEEYNI